MKNNLQLSDARFIARSAERSKVRPAERLDPADLSRLRGTFDKRTREATMFAPGADGAYEPVSFAHPTNWRPVYGWLVGVTASGEARVEVGDGQYAIVPQDELRRLGAREDRQRIQMELRRAIGQVSANAEGVRADLHETQSLMPLSIEDETLHLVSLSYAASIGFPTQSEVEAYVKRAYPTAEVLDADASMPGRIGVAVRLALDLEAEMGAAHGGEVQETLDPATVSNEAANARSAAGMDWCLPFGSGESDEDEKDEKSKDGDGKKAPPKSKDAKDGKDKQPKQAAAPDYRVVGDALFNSGRKDLVEKALQSYMQHGGGNFVAGYNGQFTGKQLLTAALPVVYRTDPSLWRSITNSVGREQSASGLQPGALPASPSANNTDGTPASSQVGRTLGEGVTADDPFRSNMMPNQSPIGELPVGPVSGPSIPNAAGVSGLPGAPSSSGVVTPPLTGTGVSSPEAKHVGPTSTGPSQTLPPMPPPPLSAPGATGAPPPFGRQPALDPYGLWSKGPNKGPQPFAPRQDPYGSPPAGYRGASRRSAFLEQPKHSRPSDAVSVDAQDVLDANDKGPDLKAAPAPGTKGSEHLLSQGLPPAMRNLWAKMKLHRFARRGIYVLAQVDFEPGLFANHSEKGLKQAIESFVKAKAGSSQQGADFGIIGRVHVLDVNAKSGRAQVQFASEHAGMAAPVVINE